MTKTSCKRCGFPIPIRWPRAGGNLAQPNGIHRCADRASICSKHLPKGLLHLLTSRTYRQTGQILAASCLIIELGARIKS